MDKFTEKLNRLENLLVDVLAVLGPWLAPIPSAYLVGKASGDHLQWPEAVTVIAGVAVESIGVVSVLLALRLYEWNQTKTKKDASAPFGLAVGAVAFYFVVTIGLTVVLDVVPEWSMYAPAIFPLLAAVGGVNIAMKNGQRRREETKVGRKRPKAQTKAKVESRPKAETKETKFSRNAQLVFEALQQNPNATNVEIAETLPITPQRVGQIRAKMNGKA